MTTGIPGPRGSCQARVLQGGGGRLQPKQAKGFCQGCLHQLHLLLLHLEPPAQGLQGLLGRALAWERGRRAQQVPHLGKPEGSLPAALRAPAAPAGRLPRGEETVAEDPGPPCGGQARKLAERLSCRRPGLRKAGRTGSAGGARSPATGVGATEGAARLVRAHGPPQSKLGAGRREPERAALAEAGTQSEDREEKRSDGSGVRADRATGRSG